MSDYDFGVTTLFPFLEIHIGKNTSIKKLEKMNIKEVKSCVTEGVTRASKTLVNSIRKNMRNHPTGNLAKMSGSVQFQMLNENSSIISVVDEQAAFYEFGTGMVGKNSSVSNPMASELGWVYDIHNHSSKGWYAPRDRFDTQVYKKLVSKEKGIYHTAGMPPHNFFYDAILKFERTDSLKRAIKKALRDRLK